MYKISPFVNFGKSVYIKMTFAVRYFEKCHLVNNVSYFLVRQPIKILENHYLIVINCFYALFEQFFLKYFINQCVLNQCDERFSLARELRYRAYNIVKCKNLCIVKS